MNSISSFLTQDFSEEGISKALQCCWMKYTAQLMPEKWRLWQHSHREEEGGFYITCLESIFQLLRLLPSIYLFPSSAWRREVPSPEVLPSVMRALLVLTSHTCIGWELCPAASPSPLPMKHHWSPLNAPAHYLMLIKSHYYESRFYCTQWLSASALLQIQWEIINNKILVIL